LGSFLIEMVLYAILVAIYYFLVLHLLGDWLNGLFRQHRGVYAAVALGLIVGQGVLLDIVTHFLLAAIIKRRTEAE